MAQIHRVVYGTYASEFMTLVQRNVLFMVHTLQNLWHDIRNATCCFMVHTLQNLWHDMKLDYNHTLTFLKVDFFNINI